MIGFKENKFIKIIAIMLVLSFGSQQTGFASTIDLRDEIDSTAVNLIIAGLAGYLSGRSIKPDWSTSQMFMATYIIPTISKQAVNSVGIKGTTGLVATTGLSTFLSGQMKYNTSQAKINEAGQRAVATLTRNLGRELVDTAKTLIAGGASQQGAFIDAITAMTMTAIKQQIAKTFSKENKFLGEALSTVAALYVGSKVRTALQQKWGIILGVDSKAGPTATKAASAEALKQALDEQQKNFTRDFQVNNSMILAQLVFRLLGVKGEAGIFLSAAAGSWMCHASIAEGAIRGVISVIVQYMSRQFRSPLHGAIIMTALGDLVKWVFTGKKQVAEEARLAGEQVKAYIAEQKQLGFELTEDQARQALGLFSGRKDLSLLDAYITASVTNAQMDMYSFGQARYFGSQDGGSVIWVRGNDVFFLNRYTDYVKDVYDNGLVEAMMNQFINSYHSQAVSDFYDAIYQQDFYVKRNISNKIDSLMAAATAAEKAYNEVLANIEQIQAERQKALLKDSGCLTPEELESKIATLEEEINKVTVSATMHQEGTLAPRLDQLVSQLTVAKETLKQIQSVNSAIAEVKLLVDSKKLTPIDRQEIAGRLKKRLIEANIGGGILSLVFPFQPAIFGVIAGNLSGRAEITMDQEITARAGILSAVLEPLSGNKLVGELKANLEEYTQSQVEIDDLLASNGWQRLRNISGNPYAYYDKQFINPATGKPNMRGVTYQEDVISAYPDMAREFAARGKRLYGVAQYLDMIGENPYYYAVWRDLPEQIVPPPDEPVKITIPKTGIAIPPTPTPMTPQSFEPVLSPSIPQTIPERAEPLLLTPGPSNLAQEDKPGDIALSPEETPQKINIPKIDINKPSLTLPKPSILVPRQQPEGQPILSPKSEPAMPKTAPESPDFAPGQVVAEWKQLPADLTGTTRTPDDVAKVNMGVIPEALEKGRIRQEVYTDKKEGIGYTTYGSDQKKRELVVQELPGDAGPGDKDYIAVYHKPSPTDPYYKYLQAFPESTQDKSGQAIGRERQYMDKIINKYVQAGDLSGLDDPVAAIRFIQDQPPNILLERARKAGVDDTTFTKMRRDLGVAHLPTAEAKKDLTAYQLRRNQQTNQYEVWKDAGGGNWQFERLVQPNERNEFPYSIQAGSGSTASGAIDAVTGQAKPLIFSPGGTYVPSETIKFGQKLTITGQGKDKDGAYYLYTDEKTGDYFKARDPLGNGGFKYFRPMNETEIAQEKSLRSLEH